jgi:uncharacterized membrane protein YfcA
VPEPVQIALTALAGVATGVLSGMFGIGGAVVSNPSVRALGASPIESVGSTLPSIIPSAISGSLRYRREGLLRSDMIAWVGGAGACASIGGSQLSAVLPGDGHLLTMGVAVLMAYTAVRTARSRPAAPPAPESDVEMLQPEPGPARVDPWRLVVIGLAAGFLSGLLGIGGGLLMVPAFSGWLRLPLKETIATSLACVAIIAVPGMANHARLGHIDWSFALPLAVGVVPGARLGAGITIGASDRGVRLIVGAGLGVLGLLYATIELVALVS